MRVLLAAGALALAACGRGETLSPADEAMEGVCEALAAVQQPAPEREMAEAAFHDRAHDPLHDLADLVEDRRVKGKLLEAKGAVENGDVSEQAFFDLTVAIGMAADAADLEPPEPCDG